MFSERQAPFFHFATPLDLPPLETPFVEHLVDVGERRTGRRIDREEAIAGFEALHRNPYFFRLLIEALLLDPASSVADGVTRVRARLGEELRYPETWLGLTALQRAVVGAIADGIEKPYGAAARRRMASLADIEEPSTSRVQAALRKLSRSGLVDSWTGSWVIEDPAFAEWVRTSGQY